VRRSVWPAVGGDQGARAGIVADPAIRVAALAIALASILVHLSAGTTLAALAAGLSERSEGGGSGFQNAIETLRFAMSLVSGWAIASALASCIGVLGVVWVRGLTQSMSTLAAASAAAALLSNW